MQNPKLWSDDKKRNQLIEEYNAVGNANPQNITEAVEKYQNRQPFSYNYENDPMYANLREAAVRNGQLAMKDTMGKATALTGGYMNSYAQRVGQSAYNQYMDALNDKIPQLEQTAYERYRQGIEDDIKNIDIQQMLYNIDQKGKDAQRDALANQIGFREDAMKQDYPLMNMPYENQQKLNYQSALDKMQMQNNIAENKAKNADDLAYQKALADYKNSVSGGNTNINIGNGSGSGSEASNPLVQTASPEYNRMITNFNTDIKAGNYDTAGDTIGSYVDDGRMGYQDGARKFADALQSGVSEGKLSGLDAINRYLDWLEAHGADESVQKSEYNRLAKAIGSVYDEDKVMKWNGSQWVKTDDLITESNTPQKELNKIYNGLYIIGDYKDSYAQFISDIKNGRIHVTTKGRMV